MKNATLYILAFLTLISCNETKTNLSEKKINNEIDKRIEILSESFKFQIISDMKSETAFESFTNLIEEIYTTSDKVVLKDNYELLEIYLKELEVEFDSYPSDKASILFNILIGLDNLIIKYKSNNNFSNLSSVTIPNKTDLKVGDTLRAKIHLSVSDNLFEPEFLFYEINSSGEIVEEYNLPSENCVGEYNMVLRHKGETELTGVIIYKTENGKTDTVDWKYLLKVN